MGKIKRHLGSVVKATTTPVSKPIKIKTNIGKVFGVIVDDKSVPEDLFLKCGGWANGLGTIFYLPYPDSKDVLPENVNIRTCIIAKPFFPNTQDYPIIGELVMITGDGPAPTTQIKDNEGQRYYLGVYNLWNNNQQNIPGAGTPGFTYSENPDIRKLYYFEGDRINLGRKGNGIRFGSTVKLKSNSNEWSNGPGRDGDPITIIVNGYVTTDSKSSAPNIEEINKEKSSIYMTSTQTVPLKPGSSIVNPQLNTIKPENYFDSQLIFNSDRITLNSKKDEVLLFAKTNIELNTDNIINLNARRIVNINSPKIFLGLQKNGDYPAQAALLGGKTHDLIQSLLSALNALANSLITAEVPINGGAVSVTACQTAGRKLSGDLETINTKLKTILSETVYLT